MSLTDRKCFLALSKNKRHKQKQQSLQYTNFEAGGFANVEGIRSCSVIVEGIVDISHAIALILSSHPNVPIIGTKGIVVSQKQVYALLRSRGKFAIRFDHFLPTLLCCSLFPVGIDTRSLSSNNELG